MPSAPHRANSVAPLLFASGFCALIYQIAWSREFRLVFGASTGASAAVVAIFVGGLGLGGLLLGPRADRARRPLELYALLEAGIAVSAAATPFLLGLVRWLYVALGGTVTLGTTAGTALRLVLAALVLAVPTVLMGGTLPAAARSVETSDDAGRGRLALLYGVNTLGSVVGCMVATFFLLEVFGTRRTLWLACLLNLLVVVAARALSRRAALRAAAAPAAEEEPEAVTAPPAPAWFVLGAAALVGFAFFLMELVWYRMLGPLLGGTVFTFGLILAMALFGIGLGGAWYSIVGRRRPATLAAFAYTCLLEAAFIAIPYALGDRVAVLALLLRPMSGVGFAGFVLGWSAVAALVVLPAAFMAGAQFPLLIALLGRGRHQVGRQVGLAYAWNTIGAIVGALAGGFGLLPLLTAPGCWQLVAALLALLGVGAMALSVGRERRWAALVAPAAAALVVGWLLVAATGPTAVWRHSPIGAGRVPVQHTSGPNALRYWMRSQRAAIAWEAEGVESSVALHTRSGVAFVLNGKIDGHARTDASTQVMSGVLGAFLHGDARSSLVIGLGTGSTAGWLGVVPTMERVDVVELEPAILRIARDCAPVNQGVLDNPKVHLRIGDAREVLLTSKRRYDLVFSEPSNPYRAGIASLFTREFYQAVARRLEPGGVFLQWVQGYEIDSQTVRLIVATVVSVFPHVEIWQLTEADMMLVASREPIPHDAAVLRARLEVEPYRTGARAVWRTDSLEGVLGRFVAGPGLATAIAEAQGGELNTDDTNRVEFGFARTVGIQGRFEIDEIRDTAVRRGEDRLPIAGEVDWRRVEEERIALHSSEGYAPKLRRHFGPELRGLAAAHARFVGGELPASLAAWKALGRQPRGPQELALVAFGLADAGDEAALGAIEQLRGFQPAEADAALARLRLRQGRFAESFAALEAALTRYRVEPWPLPLVMRDALETAAELAGRAPELAPRVFGLLGEPFAVLELNEKRLHTRARIGLGHPQISCVEALAPLEPHFPWDGPMLLARRDCYRDNGHRLAGLAQAELEEFLSREPTAFANGLVD